MGKADVGEDLTHVYHLWFTQSFDVTRIVEMFDDFLVVEDREGSLWYVPFVSSPEAQTVVFGPAEECDIEYFCYDSESLVERLSKRDVEISRPVSGRACVVTLRGSGETVSSTSTGHVQDAVERYFQHWG
jgi:hypothetical protein